MANRMKDDAYKEKNDVLNAFIYQKIKNCYD